jgi:hypothetical protein
MDVDSESVDVDSESQGTNAKSQGTAPKIKSTADLMNGFQEYIDRAKVDYYPFSPEFRAAIDLMDIMDKNGGSLTLYEVIFAWHLDHLKAEKVVHHNTLYDELEYRYNLKATKPFEVPTHLPSKHITVPLACHNVAAQTVDMLTDPNIKEEDYLFHNDDPKAGPPENWDTLADINTGRAYRQTYADRIAPQPLTVTLRQRVLLPYILYFDGCTAGQYQNLHLEILKFTVGIFKSKYRNKSCAWRNIGYVPTIVNGKGKAIELVVNSEHVDAQAVLQDPKF